MANPMSSANFYKRAEGHCDKDRCFEEYIALYEKIINEKRP